MPDVGRRETFAERASGRIPTKNASDLDAATLLAAARSVRRGAWWRAVRREGWTRAPGVARAFGILAVLACLAAGGGVSLPCPLGLFRGGEIREGAVDRARGRTGPLSPSGMEIDAMRAMKRSAAVIGVALSGSGALAQNAVEWKVSEGGNGHWYAAVNAATGDDAMRRATSMGGHLATVSDVAENALVKSIYLATGKQWAYLGLRQASGQASPGAGWFWVTGEPLSYANWTDHNGAFPTGAPDDSPCALPPWGVENDQANQGVMDFTGRWDDIEIGLPTCGSSSWNNTAILEWDADCNGDGIVDYGQILSGELADANANNIPDCCEQGTGCPANIVTNGSFEAGTPLNACASESVAAGT